MGVKNYYATKVSVYKGEKRFKTFLQMPIFNDKAKITAKNGLRNQAISACCFNFAGTAFVDHF